MKKLFLITALAISTSSFACINVSGTYIFDTEKNEETTLVQHGCSSIDMIEKNQTLSIATDGNFHQTISQDVIIEGQNLGHITVSHKATLTDKELFLDMNMDMNIMGQSKSESTKSVNTILPNGDMKSVTTYLEDGHQETNIAKRVR